MPPAVAAYAVPPCASVLKEAGGMWQGGEYLEMLEKVFGCVRWVASCH